MPNIFEQLMTQNGKLTESVRPSRFIVKTESKDVTKIKSSKIKVESTKIFESEDADFDALDAQFDVDPAGENFNDEDNDEVVLVIDPELPADEEVPEDAAQNMIGKSVYKCPICGSNYLTGESVEVDEAGNPIECPICGEDTEQVLIGEIAPVEGAGEEDTLDPVDAEDAEDDDDEPEDEKDEDEEIIEDSLKPCAKTESEDPDEVEDLEFKEDKFESLISDVIKENYKFNPKFRVKKVSCNGSKLKIEYVVREGKGKFTRGIMICEGFDSKARRISLKVRDKGAFTESFTKKPAMVVECVKIRNNIIPVSLKYDYTKKINESVYRVFGKAGKSTNFTKATRRSK